MRAVAFVALCLAVAKPVAAEPVEHFPAASSAGSASWSIKQVPDCPDLIQLSVEIPGIGLVSNGYGQVASLAGQVDSFEAGLPDLPRLARVLPVDDGRPIRIRSVESRHEDVEGVDVAPVKTEKRTGFEKIETEVTQYERRESVYKQTGFWPGELLELQEAWMGTQKLVRIECRPVQYNPATKTLRFHNAIKAVLEFGK